MHYHMPSNLSDPQRAVRVTRLTMRRDDAPPSYGHHPHDVGRAYGTPRSNSVSHAAAVESLGARQSDLGDSDPPDPTFGPFGIALRLNWLVWKKRWQKTFNHRLIVARS